MSWVSENKFLTGFGAAMLVGVGTFGYLIYSGMDKYETATGAFDAASANLKKLQETKPSLTDAHLKELLAQKQEMTDKIGTFQKELKARVLPTEPIKKEAFQDKLKEAVKEVSTKAAAANVERPKDFYLGFPEYQSKPPDDKAAPALARQLQAFQLVMDVLIKTGSIELEEFHREPLPEEGGARPGERSVGGGKRRSGSDRSDHGSIERNGLTIKFTSSDDALRKVMIGLANHEKQLFIIRNVAVQNKQMESPPRLAAAAAAPGQDAPPAPDAAAPPAPPAPTAPAPPPVVAPVVNEGPLAYVFGAPKITTTIELEILNVEEPKPNSEKPDKGGKKKDK